MRILFASANSAREYIDIEKEHRTLQKLVETGNHSLRLLPAAEVTDLQDALRANKKEIAFDVLHFSGHVTKEEGMLLRGEGRRKEALSGEQLREFLKGAKVKLVVLNACNSGPLAMSISEVVPAAIGTTRVIQDRVARRFTSSFYGALTDDCTVKEAFEAALKTGRRDSLPYMCAGENLDITLAVDSKVADLTSHSRGGLPLSGSQSRLAASR